MSTRNPKHRQIGVIRKPEFGIVDPDRPVIALAFLVDCGATSASPWLPLGEAVALLKDGCCTVAGLEGRYCLVNFEAGYVVFERLLTRDEVLETVNQLLSDGEIRHGPLAGEGVGA